MTIEAIVKAPCRKCPFRKDVPIYLRTDRRQQIARHLIEGFDFYCHQTIEYIEDEDGIADGLATDQSQICAGAAKAILASGGTTNLMRVAERLGMANLDRTVQRGAKVWSLDEWQRLSEGATGVNPIWDVEEIETCNTANDGCLAPAGLRGPGGGVIQGTESADGRCTMCDEPLCSNCADSEGRCVMCTEEED